MNAQNRMLRTQIYLFNAKTYNTKNQIKPKQNKIAIVQIQKCKPMIFCISLALYLIYVFQLDFFFVDASIANCQWPEMLSFNFI